MTATKKKSNALIVIVVLLIVVSLTVYLNRARTNSTTSLLGGVPPIQESSPAPETTPEPEVTDYTILSLGMRGAKVSKLQRLINVGLSLLGQPKITVDGHFGPITESAILFATGSKRISYTAAYNKLKNVLATKGIDINDYL